MKIANRLRFSWIIMVTAILATAALALAMMVGTGQSAVKGDDTAEQQVALAEVGEWSRAHGRAAMGLALGTDTDEQKYVDAGRRLQEAVQKAQKISPAAKDLPQALSEYAQGADAALKAVKDAAMSLPSPAAGGARPSVKPAPKALPRKAKPAPAKGAPPAPPPEETEAAPAGPPPELVHAQALLALGNTGREAVTTVAGLAASFEEKLVQARRDVRPTTTAAETGQRRKLVFSLVLIGFVSLAILGVWYMFAGFRTQVLRPIESLAGGARRVSAERDLTVAVPVQGDEEIQNLGRAFSEMMETLRGITVEMRGATDRLLSSANELGGITRVQGESIARQASALEEARRTSISLRESSRQTAGQAEGVLRVAQKAEELGRSGETALTENLSSAQVIQGQTLQVVERIARLATSAQRIAAITGTVKDLADQSNVVALNAAIEASRAGELGVGFGVVAREIRSLADRSIRATVEVRTVLAEVLAGIRESAALVEAANAGLEEGSVRTRRLGESVAGLTGIVRENLGAVREISTAVTQQGTGIGQISAAVEDLSLMMEETLKTVHTTGEAAGVLREVSQQVSSAVKVFRL
jgi:methyl-accepting chemotaxis protein